MRRIRYSITTILFLTAIAALALTFRPAWLNPPTVEQKIFGILNDDVADSEKMEKISAYVSVGEDTNKIESQLGPCWNFNTNEDGRFRHNYESGLVIDFYPDGVAYAIGYYPNPAIRYPNEISWLTFPKSVNINGHEGPGLELDLDFGQTDD